jgi:tripartite-type tricarboxylate transporter receptor subunit TctC
MTRQLIRILPMLVLLAGFLVPALAWSQAYPNRPIRLIVPYGPGGNTDNVARTFGQKLSERLGQPVVFDNRGGAAGTLGVALAAQAPNDGYTLVIGDIGSMVIANHSVPTLPYQATKDFAPIGLLSSVSLVVTTHPNSGLTTLQEVLNRARAQPGKLSYGTSGVGSPGHLATALLLSMAKVDMLHVPFKGGAQAVSGLLGQQVDMLIDGSAVGQVTGGRLRAIAVTGQRLPALPEVPGIGEIVPGYAFSNWWGLLAPAGTPDDIVARLNEALQAISAMPDVRERLRVMGLAAFSGTPQQFTDHLRGETDKVARVVKESNIKFE